MNVQMMTDGLLNILDTFTIHLLVHMHQKKDNYKCKWAFTGQQMVVKSHIL
jgi:hypothetical protein